MEVRADGSVTMVRPVFRVVMEGVRAGAAPGVVAGSLFNLNKERVGWLVFVIEIKIVEFIAEKESSRSNTSDPELDCR